jgi:hypothetical protein
VGNDPDLACSTRVADGALRLLRNDRGSHVVRPSPGLDLPWRLWPPCRLPKLLTASLWNRPALARPPAKATHASDLKPLLRELITVPVKPAPFPFAQRPTGEIPQLRSDWAATTTILSRRWAGKRSTADIPQ